MFLPPFRAAVEAGSDTVMSAFNALNGVPATANPKLLTSVLRDEWGFDGFVVSDWAAIHELVAHGIAKDGAEAARKAFLAGVDMDMTGGLYEHISPTRCGPAGCRIGGRRGGAPRAARKAAAWAVRAPGYRSEPRRRGVSDAAIARGRAGGRARGRRAAEPRRRAAAEARRARVAMVGALAASAKDQLGPHAARGHGEDTVTIIDGLRARAEPAEETSPSQRGAICATRPTTASTPPSKPGGADVVIAVLGEPEAMSGEAASRALRPNPAETQESELLDHWSPCGSSEASAGYAGRMATAIGQGRRGGRRRR